MLSLRGLDVEGVMRRRLSRFLPIVAVAVLVQVFAPVGAFRFVANAVSDPLFLATVCNNSGGADTTADLSHRHSGCCTACPTGFGAPGAPEQTAHFIVLERRYKQIVWLAPRIHQPSQRRGSSAQARAPPIFS